MNSKTLYNVVGLSLFVVSSANFANVNGNGNANTNNASNVNGVRPLCYQAGLCVG